MNNQTIIRSPLFYVGDKYRLMNQLLDLFPQEIDNFYEPFVGGGSVFLNVSAQKYFLNDIDEHLIGIHNFLFSHSINPDNFFKKVEEIVYQYNLSYSYKEDVIADSLKKKFQKTYYAIFNKDGYNKLKDSHNKNKEDNPLILYLLLIYGFNRMLRFNRAGEFNLPVGNVDFNSNVANALKNYFRFVKDKNLYFTAKDFTGFVEGITFSKNDFFYLDPPYLITASEYNKIWDKNKEIQLFNFIDTLNKHNIKFALSNVTRYNGKNNELLLQYIKKYNVHSMTSNYINYHNNSQKDIEEVLVTNY